MNQEMVFTLLTEKSADINHLPGGKPEFTNEDARHALAHMPRRQFDYCQYVFLLYDEKLYPLVSDAALSLASDEIKSDIEKVEKFIKLCELACKEQRKKGRKVDVKRYTELGVSRGEWRYRWKTVYYDVVSYLNELREDVYWHIKNKTVT